MSGSNKQSTGLPSDEDLRHITGIDDTDPDYLKSLEQNPNDFEQEFGNRFTKDEQNRLNDLSDAVGSNDPDSPWGTNLDNPKKKSKTQQIMMARKMWFGTGAIVGLLTLIISLITVLSPLKPDFVVNEVDSRNSAMATVQSALEHRLQYYFIKYLILRAAMRQDSSFTKERAYTYMGDKLGRTLFTNWYGANVEGAMEQQAHKRVVPVRQKGRITGRDLVTPSEWKLEILGDDGKVIESHLMDSKEAKLHIDLFMQERTKDRPRILRILFRIAARDYFGIHKWHHIELGRKTILEAKAAIKKAIVRQTVGRLSDKYAAYLSCLIDGGEGCSAQHLSAPPNGGEDGEINSIVDNNRIADDLAKKLEEAGLKKTIALTATGLGVLQIIGGIQKVVNDGVVSMIAYQNMAQQAVGYATTVRSMSDQVRSGDGVIEDAQALASIFDGFEQAPSYLQQAENPFVTTGSIVHAAGPITRDDCGTGKPITLAPGESFCPNHKLIQNLETIKKMPFWPPLNAIGQAYNSTLGKPFEWASSILSSTLDTLGVSALMAKVMEVTGIDKASAALVQTGLNWVIGFTITGAETGKAAYEAYFTGMSALASTVGSPLFGPRGSSMGGYLLTAAQLADVQNEQSQEQQFALSQKSLMDRYFSPDVNTSLTSYAIIHTPADMTSLSASFISAINPINIMGNISSMVTAHSFAMAGDGSWANPAGAPIMGYAPNDPILEMDENELNAKYHCDLPVDDRPQNKVMGRPDGMPFDIYTQPDPCLLQDRLQKMITGGENDL